MKKLISLLLCLSLIFLCSCSTASTVEAPVNIKLEELSDKEIFTFDINERYAVIVASEYHEDEYYYETEETIDNSWFCYVYDINKDKIKKSIEIPFKEFIISSAIIDDKNEITFVSGDDNAKSRRYNINLEEIGTSDLTFDDICYSFNTAPKNDNVNTELFSLVDNNFAYYNDYASHSVSVICDMNDRYFLSQNPENFEPASNYESKVLFYSDNGNDNFIYTIVDFDNLTKRSFNVSYDENYYYNKSVLRDKYSLILMQNAENGQCNTLTLINNSYGNSASADEYSVIYNDKLEEHIEEIKNRIKDKYDIELIIYPEYKEDMYYCFHKYTNNENNNTLLEMLYSLEYYLSTFPEDLYKELLKQYNEQNFYEKLMIFVVGEFDEDENVAAWAGDEEDDLIIVYSVKQFNYSNFSHEFMHLMDYRIWDFVPDFEEVWFSLNPSQLNDYESYPDDYNDYYEKHEEYQDYFARAYGMKSIREDEATIFEEICTYNHSKSDYEPVWEKKKPLNKKAKYLVESIKKSFPSMVDCNLINP